jgi:hypothetical protein
MMKQRFNMRAHKVKEIDIRRDTKFIVVQPIFPTPLFKSPFKYSLTIQGFFTGEILPIH